MKRVKCIRCGICCLSGTCEYGKENKQGFCKYLEINKDLTTNCKIIEKTRYLGTGCVLRSAFMLDIVLKNCVSFDKDFPIKEYTELKQKIYNQNTNIFKRMLSSAIKIVRRK